MKDALKTQWETTEALKEQVTLKTDAAKVDTKPQTKVETKQAVVKVAKEEEKKFVEARGAFVRSGSADAAMIADAAFRSSTRSGAGDKQTKQVELAKTANTLLQKIESAILNAGIPQLVNL